MNCDELDLDTSRLGNRLFLWLCGSSWQWPKCITQTNTSRAQRRRAAAPLPHQTDFENDSQASFHTEPTTGCRSSTAMESDHGLRKQTIADVVHSSQSPEHVITAPLKVEMQVSQSSLRAREKASEESKENQQRSGNRSLPQRPHPRDLKQAFAIQGLASIPVELNCQSAVHLLLVYHSKVLSKSSYGSIRGKTVLKQLLSYNKPHHSLTLLIDVYLPRSMHLRYPFRVRQQNS